MITSLEVVENFCNYLQRCSSENYINKGKLSLFLGKSVLESFYS